MTFIAGPELLGDVALESPLECGKVTVLRLAILFDLQTGPVA